MRVWLLGILAVCTAGSALGAVSMLAWHVALLDPIFIINLLPVLLFGAALLSRLRPSQSGKTIPLCILGTLSLVVALAEVLWAVLADYYRDNGTGTGTLCYQSGPTPPCDYWTGVQVAGPSYVACFILGVVAIVLSIVAQKWRVPR